MSYCVLGNSGWVGGGREGEGEEDGVEDIDGLLEYVL